MDELEDILLSEISQTQKIKCCMILLIYSNHLEIESRTVITRGWEESGDGELLMHESSFSFAR